MYVVSNLEKCGPINVLFNIINEVCCAHECRIITLSPEGSKTMEMEFEEIGILVSRLNMSRKAKKEKYLKELEEAIKGFKPDIIHTHGFRSDRYISLIKQNNTFVHMTTLHNFTFSDYPRLYGFVPGMMLACYHLFIINHIKHKIACSYSIASKYKLSMTKGISVIQNGVNIEIYKPVNKVKKNQLREKLGLPLDKKIAISTGSIIKRKRPFKLLQVFSEIKELDDVLFLVLGDGNLFSKIEKFNGEKIKLLGSVQNVTEYLQASDIFISNSKAEGLPMAMLEAAATGLIVVGSDILPHREVKDVYREKTILYKGQNSGMIANCIIEAVHRCDNHSENSECEFNLSSRKMASGYIDYYTNVKVT